MILWITFNLSNYPASKPKKPKKTSTPKKPAAPKKTKKKSKEETDKDEVKSPPKEELSKTEETTQPEEKEMDVDFHLNHVKLPATPEKEEEEYAQDEFEEPHEEKKAESPEFIFIHDVSQNELYFTSLLTSYRFSFLFRFASLISAELRPFDNSYISETIFTKQCSLHAKIYCVLTSQFMFA